MLVESVEIQSKYKSLLSHCFSSDISGCKWFEFSQNYEKHHRSQKAIMLNKPKHLNKLAATYRSESLVLQQENVVGFLAHLGAAKD